MTNSTEVVEAFLHQENLLPRNILKKGLEHYLSNPEEILNTRINFIRNYSTLCIGCYLLGIGDRHLENFLININNSEVYAIDFGISFGQGLVQIIPELIPFRLTKQIRSIIYPFGYNGVIRNTMIDVLSAIKGYKKYILDYCEVFVKEPLIDWIKNSKSETKDEYSWVPIRKLKIIENKISGMNPIRILLDELCDTRHANEVISYKIENI